MIIKQKFVNEFGSEFLLTLEHNLLTILGGFEIIAQGFVDNLNDFTNLMNNNDVSYNEKIVEDAYNLLLGK